MMQGLLSGPAGKQEVLIMHLVQQDWADTDTFQQDKLQPKVNSNLVNHENLK